MPSNAATGKIVMGTVMNIRVICCIPTASTVRANSGIGYHPDSNPGFLTSCDQVAV